MTSPMAQAALRAMMVNGRYIDTKTGRPAYYGPNGEPGAAIAQRTPGMLANTMPDGRVAYYNPVQRSMAPVARAAKPQAMRPQLPTAAQGGTALPFDGDAALMQAQLQSQKNLFESQATSEQQRITREYGLQRRAVEDQRPTAQRNLLEDYAGRGLANSSGYAYDQADQQSQFAKLLAELDQGKTEGFADLLRQRGVFNDSWAAQLQAVQAAAARRLAEQAGNLGLNDQPTGNESLFDGLWGDPNAGASQPQTQPQTQMPSFEGTAWGSNQYSQPAPQPIQQAAPAPTQTAAPAPRPQTAEEKAWAAYVAYNPTNAARVQREAQLKKEREWAAYVAYNPTNAARVAAAARR